LKAEPDYVPALMVQAKLKEMANDAASAADVCEKIIAKYPDFAPAERELAILYSRDSSKAKVANTYALKAREEYPTDVPLLKAAAIIAYQQGEFSRAAGLFKNGLTALGNDAEVYYYLGAAQYKLKDRVGSKANLQQAVALNLTGPLADSAKQMLTDLK
jgi:predicted Zn-dependent protease